jgi:effector-binding domain-containing protein
MIDAPHVTRTTVQSTAVIHLVVPRSEMQTVMGPGVRELMSTLAAQGIKPAGPWFSHHLTMPSDVFDFEISVPVSTPITAAGRVKPGALRATSVARTIHHGGYEGLGEAWGMLMAWIAENGHTAASDLWEVYVAGPESSPDPATWQTELNRPLVT